MNLKTNRVQKTGKMDVDEIREMLQASLPPGFGRPKVDELLPGFLSGKTLANLESKGEGPPSFQFGRRRVYIRESFIDWFINRMQQGQDLE